MPFDILEPVLERCTPEQLYRIEQSNQVTRLAAAMYSPVPSFSHSILRAQPSSETSSIPPVPCTTCELKECLFSSSFSVLLRTPMICGCVTASGTSSASLLRSTSRGGNCICGCTTSARSDLGCSRKTSRLHTQTNPKVGGVSDASRFFTSNEQQTVVKQGTGR